MLVGPLAAFATRMEEFRAWTPFPDLGSLSDQELKDLIQQLTDEEVDISYRRRILHGKIDILRAELVNRLRKKHEGGEDVITGADVQRLTDILAGRVPADGRGLELATARRRAAVAQHCPECGFVNAEGANYCQRCGAFLAAGAEPRASRSTATYRVGETGELIPVELDDVVCRGRRARHPLRRRARRRELRAAGRPDDDRPPRRTPTSSSTT